MADQKFRLRITAEINETDQYGAYYSNGLRVQEDVSFEADGFLKIMSVLGQFHSLAEKLKKAEEG